MPKQKTYTLEYYISKQKFSQKIDLENYVNQMLGKFVKDLSFKIYDNESKYLILSITSTSRIIGACYDKLNIERSWAFRSVDELDDLLRKNAYPILSSIEVSIRNFINRIMSEVLGFNWWDLFTPKYIQDKVKTIESKTSKFNIELQHQIEFTLFDDLIKIVTEEIQAWPDNHVVTASELVELFSGATTVEEIHNRLADKRKVMSFWEDVFSNFFDDKDAWIQLKDKIEKHVIPVRNKVMHHRLIREHELKKLKTVHGEVIGVIGSAKSQLLDKEFEKASLNALAMFEIIQSYTPDYSNLMKTIADFQVTLPTPDYSEVIKAITDLQVTPPTPDYSELMKSIIDMQIAFPTPDYSELMKAITDLQVAFPVPDYSELMKAITSLEGIVPSHDYSELMKAITNLQVANPAVEYLEIETTSETQNNDDYENSDKDKKEGT